MFVERIAIYTNSFLLKNAGFGNLVIVTICDFGGKVSSNPKYFVAGCLN